MLAIYMYHRAWARKNSDGEFFSVTIFYAVKRATASISYNFLAMCLLFFHKNI